MDTTRTITLTSDEEGWWVATDETVSVTSQGEMRTEALENLDAAVALSRKSIGREPTDDELRAMGIDPETNVGEYDELPEVFGSG